MQRADGEGTGFAKAMSGEWIRLTGWVPLSVGVMLASRALAAELAFTVKHVEQVQTFEAGDGFQLALLAQTAGMNLRLNKLTGRIKRHEHPQSQHILYLIKGEVEVTVGNETRLIGAGDLITIPQGSPHSMQKRGESEALFLDIASPPDVGDVIWHE